MKRCFMVFKDNLTLSECLNHQNRGNLKINMKKLRFQIEFWFTLTKRLLFTVRGSLVHKV